MGTKEYHKQKSAESYRRRADLDKEWLKERSQYRTIRRQEKKSIAVQNFGGLCNRCGGIFPDPVFEFHHLNHSEKDITPSKLFLLTDEKIYNELEKCIMLCANCHRILHHEEGYKAHAKRYA
jgi:hypothetical protein